MQSDPLRNFSVAVEQSLIVLPRAGSRKGVTVRGVAVFGVPGVGVMEGFISSNTASDGISSVCVRTVYMVDVTPLPSTILKA